MIKHIQMKKPVITNYLKPISPRTNRRAHWHDYHSRSLYMITIGKNKCMPVFSELTGNQSNAWVKLSPLGKIIEQELLQLNSRFIELEILRYVIMPDHIHFIVFVTTYTTYTLGKAIGNFKGKCSRTAWDNNIQPNIPVFEDRFHDRIVTKVGQLPLLKKYITENPRRLMIKQTHPDFFVRKVEVTINNERYDALGNIFLLRHPQIEPVKVSSKYSPDELHEKEILWLRTIEEKGVLVSPFISQSEKKFRDLALENGGNIIELRDNGFTERYKPTGRYFDLCAQGRLLLIAPTIYNSQHQNMTKAIATKLNELSAAIAIGDFKATMKISQ